MSARCPQSGSGPDVGTDALAAWAASTAWRAGQPPGGGLKFSFLFRMPAVRPPEAALANAKC